MTLLLAASATTTAPVAVAWNLVIDWPGQSRWIPFTSVRVLSASDRGIGARAEALSGVRVGRRAIGLLDRFVVTGWTVPAEHRPGEVEVLHLGPGFTGVGAIRVMSVPDGTMITVTERFDPPGGPVAALAVRPFLPLLRAGLRLSLRRLAVLLERDLP